MARDRSRSLFWGKARRPKVVNRLGTPSIREGSDGDVEGRNTNTGARIFAKLKGRWFSNLLFDAEIDNPEVSVPKVWSGRFEIVGDGAAHTIGSIPDFIKGSNIITVNANISLISSGAAYIFAAGHQEFAGVSGPFTEANTSAVFYVNTNTGEIWEDDVGSTWSGAASTVLITIFYT